MFVARFGTGYTTLLKFLLSHRAQLTETVGCSP